MHLRSVGPHCPAAPHPRGGLGHLDIVSISKKHGRGYLQGRVLPVPSARLHCTAPQGLWAGGTGWAAGRGAQLVTHLCHSVGREGTRGSGSCQQKALAPTVLELGQLCSHRPLLWGERRRGVLRPGHGLVSSTCRPSTMKSPPLPCRSFPGPLLRPGSWVCGTCTPGTPSRKAAASQPRRRPQSESSQ